MVDKDEFSRRSPTDAFDDALLVREVVGNWRELLPILRCPESGRALSEISPNTLSADDGDPQWKVIGDLPWFADHRTHYHADVDEEPMRRLIQRTLEGGWRDAFAKLLDEIPQERRFTIAENVLDSGRALGSSLLDLSPESSVLDIGCGWGSLSLPLARRVGRVVGMDLAGLRARFTQLRAHQEGLSNVAVLVGCDRKLLPFAEESFDAVLLNGVLEWTPMTQPGEPREVQRRFLQEVHRVLRPGGSVFVAIENRYSLLYFKGHAEDHVRLRFASLLPRWIASPYVRWRRGFPYRVWTHGRTEYKQLLRDAGFEHSEVFVAHPNYRVPRQVMREDDHGAMERLAAPLGSKWWRATLGRALARSGLMRSMAHSYLVLGRKS